MREAWVPSPGMVMVGVDAKGLQMRCLAHRLWPYDNGYLFTDVLTKHGDAHQYFQDAIKFADRTYTKNVEYGFLFGAGDAKLGLYFEKDARAAGRKPPKASRSAMGKQVRKLLMDNITGLEAVLTPANAAVKATGKLRGLDRRSLWAPRDKRTGRVMTHVTLNTILMSDEAIVMKQAIVLATERLAHFGEDRCRLVMWVHDELQFECVPEIAEEVAGIVKDSIRDAGPALGFRCPLEGDAKIGKTWRDTH